ncbi:hypothetical protein LTR70_009228 [Exophiala xenobiotica]|uniref:Uncharacterized protein n=1 Tax=Lithohypha guttulata TaxID=1690604 RepID=A0ABR0K0M9_9EURO|nr:hypothetical protein LTR24_008325 [Lithohypha guttulata]KAK5310770.1 hypothetical protein LTR70_009228 [Exophiala xenobiotica]
MRTHLGVSETSRHRRCIVLGGIGGIVVAFARRHCSFYDSTFLFNATSEVMLKVSFRRIAEVIFDHQNLHDFEDEQILAGVRQWLSEPSNSQWLMILDNYDEPDTYDVVEYYPTASHGAIIVTTRLPSEVNGTRIRVGPPYDDRG